MTSLGATDGKPATDLQSLVATVKGITGAVQAIMVYGSHARGTAGPYSDVDVLAIVAENPRNLEDGSLTVSAYLGEHLKILAQRGSLFVLHLRHDRLILYDPLGVLGAALDAYTPPPDPARLSAELTVAATGLLSATDEERVCHGAAMLSLGYYLIRSTVYDACARSGRPEFDLPQALERLDLAHLSQLFTERRLPFSESRLTQILAGVAAVLPGSNRTRLPGIAAAAVAAAHDAPLASDLLAGVLAGDTISYTTLTLPPT